MESGHRVQHKHTQPCKTHTQPCKTHTHSAVQHTHTHTSPYNAPHTRHGKAHLSPEDQRQLHQWRRLRVWKSERFSACSSSTHTPRGLNTHTHTHAHAHTQLRRHATEKGRQPECNALQPLLLGKRSQTHTHRRNGHTQQAHGTCMIEVTRHKHTRAGPHALTQNAGARC